MNKRMNESTEPINLNDERWSALNLGLRQGIFTQEQVDTARSRYAAKQGYEYYPTDIMGRNLADMCILLEGYRQGIFTEYQVFSANIEYEILHKNELMAVNQMLPSTDKKRDFTKKDPMATDRQNYRLHEIMGQINRRNMREIEAGRG